MVICTEYDKNDLCMFHLMPPPPQKIKYHLILCFIKIKIYYLSDGGTQIVYPGEEAIK